MDFKKLQGSVNKLAYNNIIDSDMQPTIKNVYMYLIKRSPVWATSGPAMNFVVGLFSATRDFSFSKSFASCEPGTDILNLANKSGSVVKNKKKVMFKV